MTNPDEPEEISLNRNGPKSQAMEAVNEAYGVEIGKAPWVHASEAITARELHGQLHREICDPYIDMAGAVLSFMLAMEQFPREKDEQVSEVDLNLAYKLMHEECEEMFTGFFKFKEAQTMENLTEFADGCIDSIYVILWSMLKMRLPVAKLFNEVQRSNMMKLTNGVAIKNEFGKVQKPAGWKPPDLFKILVDHFDPGTWNGNIRVHEHDSKR